MTTIRVRHSGLVSFATKLGSTVTGLIFSVLVTKNLSTQEFGLWQLISRTVGYVLVPTAIIGFWITRYKARGKTMGWTSLVSGFIFTAVLTVVYLVISFPISNGVSAVSTTNSNLFFFLLSTPSILLYTTAGALEALIWGTSPEKMSYGFATFEIAKVFLGYGTIALLHLSLAGAILAVIGAQIIQIFSLIIFTRAEYSTGPSFQTIRSMIKNGWIALLNNIHPLVINMDFLIVGLVTNSTNPLALYGAALIFGNVVSYSSAIASGLYPSILAGKDPRGSTNQIFELQLIFLVPMALGAIILREQLLSLLNVEYATGGLIVVIVTISATFSSLQSITDSVIAGSDTTDASERASLGQYLKSKLFYLSKINLGLASAYLIAVAVVSFIFKVPSPATASLSQYDTLGELWAIASVGMTLAGYILKMRYIRPIVKLRVNSKLLGSLVVSAIFYAGVLYFLSSILVPRGGEISQAITVFVIGGVSLVVYGGLMYAFSATMRKLVNAVFSTIL